jgi:hypothetical protein
MYVGSRGSVSAAQPEQARRREKEVQGQIDVETGDIVVVRTFEMEVDVGLKTEEFGFCKSIRQNRVIRLMSAQSASRGKSTVPLTRHGKEQANH